MKSIVFFLIIAGLFINSCSPSYHWVKSDFDPQQYEKDIYECELQRAQYEGSHPDLIRNIAGWKFLERCMKLRGYVWIRK